MKTWSTFGHFFEKVDLFFDLLKISKKMFYVKPFENMYLIHKTLTLIHECNTKVH